MADHDQMEERAIALWRRFHFPLIIVILTILSGIIGFTYTGTKREEARLAMGDALLACVRRRMTATLPKRASCLRK